MKNAYTLLVCIALAFGDARAQEPQAGDPAPSSRPRRFVFTADAEFVADALAFRKSVEEYRNVIDLEDSIEKPLKELDRLIDRYKDYFRTIGIDHPPAAKTEFDDFSRKDLRWETLTSAERIDTALRVAAQLVTASNQSGVVSIQMMTFMQRLDGEILRLEVLISVLKERPRAAGNR